MPSRFCCSKVHEVQLFEASHRGATHIFTRCFLAGRPRSRLRALVHPGLSERVDAIMSRDRYDYPASCLADIGLALAPVMPTSEPVMDVPAAQLTVPAWQGATPAKKQLPEVSQDAQPDPSGSRYFELEAGHIPHLYETRSSGLSLHAML